MSRLQEQIYDGLSELHLLFSESPYGQGLVYRITAHVLRERPKHTTVAEIETSMRKFQNHVTSLAVSYTHLTLPTSDLV